MPRTINHPTGRASAARRAAIMGPLVLAIMCVPRTAFGLTPLAVGTAGADLSLAFGIDALFANPAHLALERSDGTEVRLFSVGGGLRSNGLGLTDYRRYSGATLDETDKQAILGRIPLKGQVLTANGDISALAVHSGSWGFALSGFGAASGRVDREVIDLLLHGNADQGDWNFAGSSGQAMAAGKAAISYGTTVWSINRRPLCVGLSAAYLHGLYYSEADNVRADLATQTSGLTGGLTGDWLSATGGWGGSLDLGAAWEPSSRSIISLKVENLINTIHWNRDVRLKHYDLTFADLTVDNFRDSLWVADQSDAPHAAVNRGLPARVRLGFGYGLKRTRLSVEVASSASPWSLDGATPVLSAGMEHHLGSVIPLRLGGSVDKAGNFALGGGAGIHLGPLHWDWSLGINQGVWIGSGRGLAAATTMDIIF
ncbi:MAG: hypothetical protein HY304_04415 [candidate division Zixibacteria bacterium]|nr:hypothetical protein [candidate division Zixibacteria bacterium]